MTLEESIVYGVEKAPAAAEVAELYRRAPLRRPVDDLDRIGKMIEHSNLIVCARTGSRLVGIARALCDFGHVCYLADLAVDPEFQRRGMGKALIARVQKESGEETALLLLAAPLAKDYYRHIGFQFVENGWILPRVR